MHEDIHMKLFIIDIHTKWVFCLKSTEVRVRVHVIFIFNLVIFGFNVGKIRISSANQNTALKLKSNYGALTPLYAT
jgi:hypothetical protein